MTKVFFYYFSIICFSSLVSQKNLLGQSADIVITNGKIFTSDTNKLYVQALAIKGNKIIAAGTNAEIEKFADNKTKRINLQGKTVVPGFNDAHDHPGWGAHIGKSFGAEFSVSGPGEKAVIDSVARLAKQAKPNEWISGLIGTTVFSDAAMRNLLDSVAPNNPVQLQVMWGHGNVINKKALEACGYTDDSKDPLGGWFVRNSSNKIFSLYENAGASLWLALHEANKADIVNGLQQFAQERLSMGITSVQ